MHSVVPSGKNSLATAINRAQPGEILEIGPGTYSENIIISKCLQLRAKDPHNPPVIQPDDIDKPTIVIQNCQGVSFQELIIDGGNESTSKHVFTDVALIDMDNATLFVHNCEIMQSYGYGVKVTNGSTFGMHGGQIHRCTGVGVYALSKGVNPLRSQVTLEQTAVFKNGKDGVQVLSGGSLFVRWAKIHSNQRSGICISTSDSAHVSFCELFDNMIDGLTVESIPSDIQIYSNHIHDNKGLSIMVVPKVADTSAFLIDNVE